MNEKEQIQSSFMNIKIANEIALNITELLEKYDIVDTDEIISKLGSIKKIINDNSPADASILLTETTYYKINKLYRNMGQQILRVLNDSNNFNESMQEIIRVIKLSTGVDAVGIRLEDGDDYPYFTQDGFSEDFLSKENSLLVRDRTGGVCRDSNGNVSLECTCGLILSGQIDPDNPIFTPGGSSWTNNSFPYLDAPAESDPRLHPRNTCIHQGYASVALIPIRAKGKIVGLLQLNDHRKDRFTIEAIESLETIAENIGEAMLRKQAEHQLKERMKELKAFFNLMEITERENNTLSAIHQEFINILPESMQYPDITCGRIVIDGEYYQTKKFSESEWMLSAPIKVRGKIAGKIDIYYLDKRPTLDEGPFMYEERLLINVIADRLGHITSRKWMEDELRNSEGRYKALFNNNHAVMLLIDPKTGYIKDANPAACKYYGWNHHEMLQKKISEINILTDAEIAIAMADSIAEKRNHYIFKHKLADGSIRDVEAYVGPINIGSSKLLYSLIHDITERKKTEDELRQSELRHKTLLQTAMDGFWMVDSQGSLVEVNETYCRMTGYSESELLKMKISDLEEVESSVETQEHMKNIIKNGQDRFESRHRCKDGNVIDVEVSVQYKPDEDMVVVFLREITERKIMEDVQIFLAKASDGKQEQFFNSLARFLAEKLGMDYICIDRINKDDLTAHTVAVWHDGKFEDNVSYTLKDTPCAEVIDKSICFFPNNVTRLFPNDIALQNLKAESYAGITLVSHTGHPIGLIAVIGRKPLSNSNIVESMLKLVAERAVGELERMSAEEEKLRLENMLNQTRKMESIGRLAGGVAHDFNNMLCVILGHAEMALSNLDSNNPVYNDLREILYATERSVDLTRQLLAFARKQNILPKVVDLNQTVSGMLKMLKRLIGENIELDWHEEKELWPIIIDPSQIDQILANLCVNARGAINDSGNIVIETSNCRLSEEQVLSDARYQQGEYVKLSVTDNGCGIDKETMEHIFEPFFTTKGNNEGTGLGLATVYGAVKQNNGFIIVESKVGYGSEFNIFLPRYTGNNDETTENKKSYMSNYKNKIILVVEDEKIILKLTAAMLTNLGYKVMLAASPDEAIEIAKNCTEQIDMLITDVVMPGMNGRELSNNIMKLCPGIKSLFISGYTADVIANHGVLDEGVNFLQKPFTVKELSKKVYEAFELSEL